MKRLAWGTAALLLFLGLVVAASYWLTSTASGFLWLAKQATPLTSGRLVLEGVQGHLASSVRIGRLTYKTETQRIVLQQVRLDWSPQALRERLVQIDLLAAQHVVIETLKTDPTPPTYPASLRLPLDILIKALDLAQLELVDAGQRVRFDGWRGSLDGRGNRFEVTARGSTPWADVQARFDIAKDAPFSLHGRVNVTRATPVPVEATVRLSGVLKAIDFKLDARAEGMDATATGMLAPYAKVRLPRLLVSGQGLDPQKLAPGAPHANLAFSGIFEGRPDERLLGTFSLANRAAGRLDAGRLPLASLSGAVLGGAEQGDISSLEIDLGAAGRLTGSGQWRQGNFELTLSSPRLNLAGVHSALNPTRMQTALQVKGDAAGQTLVAEVTERWGKGSFTLRHADAKLSLVDAAFRGQAGQLTARGSVSLDGRRAFTAQFDASQINPARFGKYPSARLNARGEIAGTLQPTLSLQTQFTLPPGQLEGRPVSGRGQLRYAEGRLSNTDIDVLIAGNTARIKGAIGKRGDALQWDIDAPALARLQLGFSGQLKSQGRLSGDPRRPQINAQVSAKALRAPGEVAVDALDLTLELEAAQTGRFSGKLEAEGLQLAGQSLSRVTARIEGQRNAHSLWLDARWPEWQATATLTGGLSEALVWRGQITQAELKGAWPLSLRSPAPLILSAEQQQVSALNLALAGGTLSNVEFSRKGKLMSTRGTANNLPVAPLLELMAKPLPVATDLRMKGNWDLRLGETLDGEAHLTRQAGDVRLLDPAMNLGLTTLALDLTAAGSRVNAALAVVSREAGSVRAEGTLKLARTETGWQLPRTAPLSWHAVVDVPNLRIVKPLLPLGVRVDAKLAARLSGAGSLADPSISGTVMAQGIRFTMPEEGVSITDGTVKLVLADDKVRVEQGELKGLGGRIVLGGEAEIMNPHAGLTLRFEKFTVTSRSDRQVTVSGTTLLNLDPKRLELTGELTVDRARLEMPAASKPELSSDVVVVSRPPPEKSATQRLPLALDLKLNLGDDFLFKGAGLDVRLGGQLRVFTVNQVMRAEGTVRVVKGRYAAYAQTLDIERGVLRFVGPIDNPGLDVLAIRKSGSVKAGVQVGGTVQRPVVKLYSDPPMPDTEKLAWLVLGHGLENSGQQEFVLMQIAAAALLSKAESVNFQSKLADTLGIDSFDVRAADGESLSSAVVSVGKRLSARATLSYEQSLDGLSQVVKVLYQLTPSVRLEAQAGHQSSFDAFYTREYD